jgi:predicted nucleic acid-binding Zn ribbon protein
MRKFTQLKDVLPLALGKVASKTTSAEPLRAVWGEVVGKAIAHNAQPLSLVHGELLVQTSNRAWAEELARRAPELLPKLQAQLGGATVVRALAFTVKP